MECPSNSTSNNVLFVRCIRWHWYNMYTYDISTFGGFSLTIFFKLQDLIQQEDVVKRSLSNYKQLNCIMHCLIFMELCFGIMYLFGSVIANLGLSEDVTIGGR